jgi:hypothetical protein
MVGFILIELLAIICLLQYCCRARYVRKRKYTEVSRVNFFFFLQLNFFNPKKKKQKQKEIILSDQAEHNTSKVYFNDKVNYSQSTLDTTHTQLGNKTLERHSLSSLRPILLHPTQQDQTDDTIMIDDFTSIYSTNNQTQQHHQKVHKAKRAKQPYGSVELLINPEPCSSRKDDPDEYAMDRMRQELTSEDVYTLRFSTSLPVEPAYDPTQNQHKSYLYDGGVSRPVFEIVSHADVRPATPIQFEEAKELAARPNRKSCDDYCACFESQSWFESKKSRRSSSHKYARSHTSPIRPLKLHYGSEQSVRNTGEPVEWQVAGELRTTDWDKLKKCSSSSSSCSKQPNESRTSRMYERNQHQPIQGDRYVLSKRFQPGNATKRISLSQAVELDEENYSEIRHSTLNEPRRAANREQSKYAANDSVVHRY